MDNETRNIVSKVLKALEASLEAQQLSNDQMSKLFCLIETQQRQINVLQGA